MQFVMNLMMVYVDVHEFVNESMYIHSVKYLANVKCNSDCTCFYLLLFEACCYGVVV